MDEDRNNLIEEAKSYGVPEALLEKLNATSLKKIVEYEKEARARDEDATEKV